MEINVNRHIASTLHRIREVIASAVRSYESTKCIDYSSLNSAERNLRRISSSISLNTYNKLFDALNGLMLLQNGEQQQSNYSAPRANSDRNYILFIHTYFFI